MHPSLPRTVHRQQRAQRCLLARHQHLLHRQHHGGNAGEADLLYSSYHNSLTLAAKHGLRSVAFPSISTGVYSYPIKEAAQIAVKAVKDFSKSNPGAIDKVFWVLRDDNTFNAYSDAIGKETASYGVSDIIGFHLPTEPFGFLSNWYEAEFDSVDLHFTSSEQYMMYEKVCLAKEYDLADKIMHTKDPAKAKEYAGSKYFKTYDSIKITYCVVIGNGFKSTSEKTEDGCSCGVPCT